MQFSVIAEEAANGSAWEQAPRLSLIADQDGE
jgi:hypothetical protein